jgi:Raf kinase inhibitor-like YbhB/YbcL family protein
MTISLRSPAFEDGKPIPNRYTCEAEDVSPPLTWSGLPAGTMTIALICDDPDAPMGTWVHWVLYGVPATQDSLEENLATKPELPNKARQGVNDFRSTGYGGPCPPPGKTHRYFFKIYALNADLVLKPGANKKQLLDAMKGHIIGEGQLMGTYKR